ncbi:hypothetical protein NDU88_007630 [Pleurodeles waltl]|uniref:Uncharacterized protein n=1 Tax=Pleurodeles waltl TaxID=8319 RepID=A0AAV7VT03_PLEWA|nr:hypothetical protein NDU88_007630 [Pleurodeles waltl]
MVSTGGGRASIRQWQQRKCTDLDRPAIILGKTSGSLTTKPVVGNLCCRGCSTALRAVRSDLTAMDIGGSGWDTVGAEPDSVEAPWAG